MCPAPPKHSTVPLVKDVTAGDHRIYIDSDDAMADAEGHAVVNGHVKVSQDARTVAADSMNYDYKTGKLAVKGAVDFEDPKVRVKSDNGTYDTAGGAAFDQANFEIFERRGHGFASQLEVHPDGKVALDMVRYTTCPVGNEDWMLQASSINLDTEKQEGVARDVLMRFKNVPVFYTPYISFPLGDERKSGVLFPSFGHSGSDGYQIQVPYYFNLAPNYDLTLTPGYLSARGVQLGAELRFLTTASHGSVEGSYLPGDSKFHGDRSYLHVTDTTDLQQGLRFDADIASVSDVSYFEDFAVGSEETSVTYLERRAEVLYYDDVWRIRGQLQNFQTIDNLVDSTNRPYSRVPRVQAEGLFPVLNSDLEFALNGEATNFLRETGPTGVRVNVSPEIRWSQRGSGYFFEPAVGYDFTQYDLKNAAVGQPSTPSRSLPYARLDTGLIFERNAGSQGQRTQTLEPRLVYSYVPYRNQDELPIFDSGLPDLNLTELFRTNRFVGGDRIGDADQLSMGLTTRLFDQVTGAQYLAATIGQIRYFSVPRVSLPEYVTQQDSQVATLLPAVNSLALPGQYYNSRGQYLYAAAGQTYSVTPSRYAQVEPGQTNGAFPASDIVADVALTAYKNVSVNLDYQLNPYTSRTDKSEVGVQYHPGHDRVINLGYRFQSGILKQYDGSFAWPIAEHWNTVGRWVYSLQDHQTIEQIAGFEYKSCCYRIQMVQRRYVSNRTGGLDTSIALQLELTGLSSVGKPANVLLEREISGYSARDPAEAARDSGVP